MAILLNVRNGPDQSKCMMCVWWSYMCQKPFSARFCGAVVLNRTTNKLTCQNINNNCASSSELLNRFKSYYLDKDNLIILCMWQCMQAKHKVDHIFIILGSPISQDLILVCEIESRKIQDALFARLKKVIWAMKMILTSPKKYFFF